MRFTVVWQRYAIDDLARVWLASTDRRGVTAAANCIDRELAMGRSRNDQEPPMRHRSSAFAGCVLGVLWLSHAVLPEGEAEANDDSDQVLFDFEGESSAMDWTAVKLPEVESEQPSPTIEIVPSPKA